jgi:hypothetical protein
MRRLLAKAAIVAALGGGIVGVASADVTSKLAGKALPKSEGGATCGRHGTAVEFVPTPNDAAAQARREQKLVLVLHVSGHFETPEFT